MGTVQLLAHVGLLAQAKTLLWRSSQLRRHASSAIAMFPGLSHSSLAYYAAVPSPCSQA